MSKTIKEMQAEVREVNEANGWFDSDRSFGDGIALLHSEVSEAFEAYRSNGLDDFTAIAFTPMDLGRPEDNYRPGSVSAFRVLGDGTFEDGDPAPDPLTKAELFDLAADGLGKPEGVGSEFADILIRLLDEAERQGIDLDFEYARKVAFNRTRGHRHGGKLV
jgi:NTP pyrophosphatase (non-canonical NTP hydrolase)